MVRAAALPDRCGGAQPRARAGGLLRRAVRSRRAAGAVQRQLGGAGDVPRDVLRCRPPAERPLETLTPLICQVVKRRFRITPETVEESREKVRAAFDKLEAD